MEACFLVLASLCLVFVDLGMVVAWFWYNKPDLLGSVVVDLLLVFVDQTVVVIACRPVVSALGSQRWFVFGFGVVDWRIEVFLLIFLPVVW